MNQLNRKLISFLMLLMLSMTAQASIDSTLSSIKDNVGDLIATTKANADTLVNEVDTSAISKQVYSDVKSALIGMAGALKVGAEHVYSILVKQQIVLAVMYILLFIMCLVMIKTFLKAYKSEEKGKWWIIAEKSYNIDYPTLLGVIRFLHIFVAVIIGIVAIANIDIIIGGIINPEYGAIKEILDLVKK